MGIFSWVKRRDKPEKPKVSYLPMLQEHLIREEGERLKPYKCTAGKLTIGVGRNLEDVGITREESRYLLLNDMVKVEAQAKAIFPDFDDWSIGRQVAISSMIFQLGRSGFLEFKTTIKLLKEGKWEEASKQALKSKWATQTPNRARRVCEMIRTGDHAR
jgi:lysozyme